jgi:S-adenosylmethionine synthetase
MRDFVHTSEAFAIGHPDKLCDQISDAVVDACLAADPPVRCVAECAMASGIVFLSIRHGGRMPVDPAALARRVLAESGYPEMAEAGRATVMLDLVSMAEEEARGPGRAPGQMTTAFGYATDRDGTMLPLPLLAARGIAGAVGRASLAGEPDWLAADAQAQVAVRYEARRPVSLDGVALLWHGRDATPGVARAREMLEAGILRPALAGLMAGDEALPAITLERGTGAGGPRTHSGLTGRKTASDSYGSFVRHSGSALSGKDPARIDRVAAYAARQAAVSLVAAGLCRECEVQLSYVVGEPVPASLEIDSFGSAEAPEAEIAAMLRASVDLAFPAVAERLGLWSLPAARGGRFYRDLAAHGHFGRPDADLPWERPVPVG